MKKLLIFLAMLVCLAGVVWHAAEDLSGTVRFYSEPAREFTDPVSVTSVGLSKEQVKEIRAALDNVNEWINDHAVDRLAYYFDGDFEFSDRDTVYYFSYAYNVIYYDHYFGEIAGDEMQYIRDIMS